MADREIYDLADALGMQLSLCPKGRIRGRERRELPIGAGGQKLTVPLEVVSSLKAEDVIAILCRALGDLGLVAIRPKGTRAVDVGVLDLSRLGDRPEDLFERQQVDTIVAAHALLETIEVKAFQLVKGRAWQEIGAS